ncbi:MAG: 16S rRNA (uracil(1498)-N(3))-methyltransferase [Candidatus Dormibacteraeota bacterium]|nr:16S rRNA (uracil(1498)-N(3))-methyltransferase [Candidatus Dormibacteraeota bacterium]MBV8445233.1 16S rRNA (uracil(1498)-N(3))-methyltransferase [Candidatus Dormibacteraeota bacterium]
MPRFFVTAGDVGGGRVTVRGDDAAHLARSLRVRPGEIVVVVEDGRTEHGMRVGEIAPEAISGDIVWSRPAGGEPPFDVTALLAVAAQHMDHAVEGLVVAGATSIHPVATERSVVRLDAGAAGRRTARWQSVATNAAQLAGRAFVPPVAEPVSLHDALRAVPARSRILACVIDEAALPLAGLAQDGRPVAVVIGPEGGLGRIDREVLAEHGAELVHLGPRTFPHHLAGTVAVSLLLAAAGDMSTAMQAP